MSESETLLSTGDVFINSAASGFNNNGDPNLRVGEDRTTTSTCRSLIIFPLSNIRADAIVISAKLRLYLNADYADNARTMSVYRTFRDWVESQANWTVWKTGSNWATAGGFNASDTEQTTIGDLSLIASETINVWKEINLDPSKIQEMINGTFVNYGFLIKMATELNDQYRFNSEEQANYKPELVIEYYIGSENYLKNRGRNRLDLSGISLG